MHLNLKRKIASVLALLLLIPTLAACSKKDGVVVASKDYTENKILGEMLAQLIENKTDLNVERKLNMGGTFVCFEAIKKGEVDIYPEYTGTALTAYLKLPVDSDADKVYQTVSEEFEKQFQITWLDPFGYNNTYALAMPKDLAEENGIESISDLAVKSDQFVFGAEHEFFNREDGYDGLVDTYGLKFKEEAKMENSLKYQAIGQGKMDVTDAYTTDGQLKALNLKVLKDDKNFFPPYYAAPIIRDDTLEKYPELREVLNSLSGKLDEETMQDLNYQVDNEKKSIEEVATAFLKGQGLI
jgi:osmoprotectant transport system substrate-binding protein